MEFSNNVSVAAILLLGCSPTVAAAQNASQAHGKTSEFLLFLSGDYLNNFDADTAATENSEFTPAADFLYSRSFGSWRFLAEYLLTADENELERVQLGYDASEESTFVFGRFHTPASAWVAKYHHGRFLQSSITRPAIEEWEDDGGVIPAHISGAMIEQGIPLDTGNGTRLALTVGGGPYIENQELKPFDFLDPGNGKHGLSGSVTFAYFPDYLSDVNIGFSLSHSQLIVLEDPFLGISQEFDVNQSVVGIQIDWRRNDWQVLAASYYIHNDTEAPDGRFGGWFASGYAELQWSAEGHSTIYLRGEASTHTESVDYLNLFPDFVTERIVAGFRYEITDSQAVTLEISDQDSLRDGFRQVRAQWSAVFP